MPVVLYWTLRDSTEALAKPPPERLKEPEASRAMVRSERTRRARVPEERASWKSPRARAALASVATMTSSSPIFLNLKLPSIVKRSPKERLRRPERPKKFVKPGRLKSRLRFRLGREKSKVGKEIEGRLREGRAMLGRLKDGRKEVKSGSERLGSEKLGRLNAGRLNAARSKLGSVMPGREMVGRVKFGRPIEGRDGRLRSM